MSENATAGPSSRPDFPPAVRVDDYFPPTDSGPASRASTPSIPRAPRAGASFNSITDKRRNEIVNKHRHESAQRLKTAWERLLEKYGHIRPEDDDEIDLATGKVVKYRAGLLEFREDGGELPGEESDETESGSLAQYESDEDELGGWDDRSGLDDQGLEGFREEEKKAVRPWNEEDPFDRQDREEFLRMEALRNRSIRAGSEEEDDVVEWSSQEESSIQMIRIRRSQSGEVEPEPIEADSDDELLAHTSEAEEATRVVYVNGDVSHAILSIETAN